MKRICISLMTILLFAICIYKCMEGNVKTEEICKKEKLEIIKTDKQIKENNDNNGSDSSQKSVSYIDCKTITLCIISIILLVIIIIPYRVIIKTSRNVRYYIQEQDKYNRNYNKQIKDFEKRIQNLEKEKIIINKEKKRLEEEQTKKKDQVDYFEDNDSYPKFEAIIDKVELGENSNDKKYKYLKIAKNGQFKQSYNEFNSECFFRYWKDSEKLIFEFCGDTGYALANEPAIFDNVCKIYKGTDSPSTIETLTTGILDSNLKVIQKSTIKFK